MLSCHTKLTLTSIKSLGANIITGLGLDNPRSQTTNLQKTTGNTYQTTTEKLMTSMLCPKLSNGRFRVSGQGGYNMFSDIFLGPL